MKYLDIKGTDLKASNIVMGCMHLSELTKEQANRTINTALECGVNFFDHADCYDDGKCETLFAEAMNLTDDQREKMIIQSKCGIVKVQKDYYEYFDFSKEHILEAVDGSLKRLKTDYLDVLLLHRPDVLMVAEEIAEAFDILESSGKVKNFGVSNFNPMQSEYVKKHVKQRLAFNQMQFSLAHTGMVDTGLTVNMTLDQSFDKDGSVYEYSKLNDVTIQAWSPLQKGFFGGPFLKDFAKYSYLNQVLNELAEKYNTTNTSIAIAWIACMPINMQIVTGTTNPQRMKDCCAGSEIKLTKEEWYRLYTASGNIMP